MLLSDKREGGRKGEFDKVEKEGEKWGGGEGGMRMTRMRGWGVGWGGEEEQEKKNKEEED